VCAPWLPASFFISRDFSLSQGGVVKFFAKQKKIRFLKNDFFCESFFIFA
jgi:hypothetical protein